MSLLSSPSLSEDKAGEDDIDRAGDDAADISSNCRGAGLRQGQLI